MKGMALTHPQLIYSLVPSGSCMGGSKVGDVRRMRNLISIRAQRWWERPYVLGRGHGAWRARAPRLNEVRGFPQRSTPWCRRYYGLGMTSMCPQGFMCWELGRQWELFMRPMVFLKGTPCSSLRKWTVTSHNKESDPPLPLFSLCVSLSHCVCLCISLCLSNTFSLHYLVYQVKQPRMHSPMPRQYQYHPSMPLNMQNLAMEAYFLHLVPTFRHTVKILGKRLAQGPGNERVWLVSSHLGGSLPT